MRRTQSQCVGLPCPKGIVLEDKTPEVNPKMKKDDKNHL